MLSLVFKTVLYTSQRIQVIHCLVIFHTKAMHKEDSMHALKYAHIK